MRTIRWAATFGAQVHFQMCKCQSMESKIFKLKSNKIFKNKLEIDSASLKLHFDEFVTPRVFLTMFKTAF